MISILSFDFPGGEYTNCASVSPYLNMCIVKITKYTGCPTSHSLSEVSLQHANAIYCPDQEVLKGVRSGKCPVCRAKDLKQKTSSAGSDAAEVDHRKDSAVDCT